MGSVSIWHWIVVLVVLSIMFSPVIFGFLIMGPQKKVRLIHAQSGLTKEGYVGYCWTYFFFGFFVPLFRGEIGIALIHLILAMITFGLFQIVMSYLYNKQYMTRLITNGWDLYDTPEMNQLARMKLGIVSQLNVN